MASSRTLHHRRWGTTVLAAVAVLLAAGCVSPAMTTDVLRPAASTSMPGVAGRIDHFAVDLAGKRLFVAALGSGTVEVLDLAAGRRVARIPGLREPQGMAYLPRSRRLVVSEGGGAAVQVFDGRTLRRLRSVPTRDDPDNVRDEAAASRVWIGEGSGRDGAMLALDGRTGSKIAEIPVAGHPEAFALEPRSGRIYVNVPSASHVAEVDGAQRRVIAAWSLDGSGGNFPMALDAPQHRLFVGCRTPARLLALDTGSGRIVASFPCPGDADDVWYDAATRRIYVTGGDGRIGVFEEESDGNTKRIGDVATAPGARTSIFVPEWHALFVGVPGQGAQAAQVRRYDVAP